MLRKKKKDFERNICNQSKVHSKAFWSHIQNDLKTRTRVSPLLQDKEDQINFQNSHPVSLTSIIDFAKAFDIGFY